MGQYSWTTLEKRILDLNSTLKSYLIFHSLIGLQICKSLLKISYALCTLCPRTVLCDRTREAWTLHRLIHIFRWVNLFILVMFSDISRPVFMMIKLFLFLSYIG